MQDKVVVLLSGGLDSSTLLYEVQRNHTVVALSVLYGQRHDIELDSAGAIALAAGVPHVVCNASSALEPVFAQAKSSQVGTLVEVPKGHYADETMRTTIVPNRNMVLLALAGALAESIGAKTVAYAAHAGDHAIYPDCRPPFIEAMSEALRLSADIDLLAPFRNLSKAQIVERGSKLGVPFSLTYSCYVGKRIHCGACGTCYERREAFQLAHVSDPTAYAVALSKPPSEL